MNCPKCGSVEVRPSTRARWFDPYFAFGRQRFRCRDCRRSFYARENAGLPVVGDSRTPKPPKRSQEHRHRLLSKRNQRRLLEALIFAVMLALFILFLRYLTSEPTPANPVSGGSFILDTRNC